MNWTFEIIHGLPIEQHQGEASEIVLRGVGDVQKPYNMISSCYISGEIRILHDIYTSHPQLYLDAHLPSLLCVSKHVVLERSELPHHVTLGVMTYLTALEDGG